jgi:hypothetical protein
MAIVGAVVLLALVISLSAHGIVRALDRTRREAAAARALSIVQTLAPGIEAARRDPRSLLVWYPLAGAVRRLFPAECAALDTAAGRSFPFPPEQLQAAHAQWTADWLAWERTHDAEYKSRAAAAEQDLAASSGSAAARARLDAIEREKLDSYQRRYQDYVQVAKALQSLIDAARPGLAEPIAPRPRD